MHIRTISSTNDVSAKAAPSGASSTEDLFAQFSQTLDQIASKISGKTQTNTTLKNLSDSTLPTAQNKKGTKLNGDTLFSLSVKNSLVLDSRNSLASAKSNRSAALQTSIKSDPVSKPDNAASQSAQTSKTIDDTPIDPDAQSRNNQKNQDSNPQPDSTAVSTAAAQILSSQKTVTESQPSSASGDPSVEAPSTVSPEVAASSSNVVATSDQANSDSAATDASAKVAASTTTVAQASVAATASATSEVPGAVDAHLAELQAKLASRQAGDGSGNPQSSEAKVEQKKADELLEKLILEQALGTDAPDQSASTFAATLSQNVELSLQNQNNGANESLIKLAATGQMNILSAANAASAGQAQGLQSTLTQSLKSAENAGRGATKETMKTLTHPQESRTMEKVESALREVSRAKDGKMISVRLDPPDLGTVKIDVSLRDGNLHARVVAETPQVTALLKEKANELVEMMKKLGLNVDKVTVAVNQQQQEGSNSNLLSSDSSQGDAQQKHSGNQSSPGDHGAHDGFSTIGDLQATSSTLVDDHWVA